MIGRKKKRKIGRDRKRHCRCDKINFPRRAYTKREKEITRGREKTKEKRKRRKR